MMTVKVTKIPIAVEETPEVHTQGKRPPAGRFHLQVDRQTKKSFSTSEAALEEAVILKRKYPLLQVVIYDSIELSRAVTELSDQ